MGVNCTCETVREFGSPQTRTHKPAHTAIEALSQHPQDRSGALSMEVTEPQRQGNTLKQQHYSQCPKKRDLCVHDQGNPHGVNMGERLLKLKHCFNLEQRISNTEDQDSPFMEKSAMRKILNNSRCFAERGCCCDDSY